MGWFVVLIVLVGAGVVIAYLQNQSNQKLLELDRKHREVTHALETEHGDAVRAMEEEHERRTGRLERDHERRAKQAPLKLVQDLLPALDAMERALEDARARDADPELVRGLELVMSELHTSMARHDVQRVAPGVGDDFDPAVHEAVAMVDTADQPDRAVVECYRAGWVHTTKTIRPAMVQVARNPAWVREVPEEAPSDDGEVILDLEGARQASQAGAQATQEVEEEAEAQAVEEVHAR